MDLQPQPIWIGDSRHQPVGDTVQGDYITMLGERYYRIAHYDRLPPFFMSVVSSSDHWLFISSTGGLSAGRVNAELALFPYYTVDKITENSENTGSKTILLVRQGDHTSLWEPFSARYQGIYRIERHLYKNIAGDALIFEEMNHTLGLSFRYAWRTSDQYGFVKTGWLHNLSGESREVQLLDGLQNLLPYGATAALQGGFSNLLDAYKRAELDSATGLGIFTLSATLTDLAEPSESLKATTVWQVGLPASRYLLSNAQLDRFRRGEAIEQETDVRGQRGAYFVYAALELAAGSQQEWHIVADVNQDSADVVATREALKMPGELSSRLEYDIRHTSEGLAAIIACADGLQLTGDQLSAAHHWSNVLFNSMRGGIFADGYRIDTSDLRDFIAARNRNLLHASADFFAGLPATLDIHDLVARAANTGDPNIERLCYAYLPLTFSRRHGDPSRPWNTFSINLKNPNGTRQLDYQGNWRDIFQNWEPLAYSYPEFIEGMICTFLSATTADGYNPYRITRAGIEWEVPEPDNPWANIGYWSDHQIIYLEKLMEISSSFHPGRLAAMLGRRIFSHAHVPYHIKPYAALLEDGSETIDFDWELQRQIDTRIRDVGTDGKLVLDAGGQVFHISMAEKLLLLLLAKLANFVPEGGIWMNTQRPEWNDANNALVGKGLSVVTLCYLRRYIDFCKVLFAAYDSSSLLMTVEVKRLLDAVYAALHRHQSALDATFDNAQRRAVMDELGQAASAYRWGFYRAGLSGEFTAFGREAALALLDIAQRYVEHALHANRRDDDLYHSYNILELSGGAAAIGRLDAMLEGQVAILSSGMLTGTQSLAVLRSLRASPMYRADQHSYMLYPDRELPGFLHKNCLSADQIRRSALVTTLLEQGDQSLIIQDQQGVYHFNGSFRNAKDVRATLALLRRKDCYTALVDAEAERIVDLFDTTFAHRSFTGRSGKFFAYEGLGSIYWHMVAKLLLAVQETYWRAAAAGDAPEMLSALAAAYDDIRQGLGFNKSPDIYGAFPTDPYSHTPAGRGAQQPGMTGQVKEEILTRFGELGLVIAGGALAFKPALLHMREYTTQPATFHYVDVNSQSQAIDLPTGALAYTFCQVPIVYLKTGEWRIVVLYATGHVEELSGDTLNAAISQQIFRRDGHIRQLIVYTQ